MYGDGKKYEWKDVENNQEYEIEYVGKGYGPIMTYIFLEYEDLMNYFIQTANHPIQKGKWKKIN